MIEKINIQLAIVEIRKYLLDLQNAISHFVESHESDQKFLEDNWLHAEGGGGKSRVLSRGNVFEKAGVNFSHIHGFELPLAATLKRPLLKNASYQALGVSTVIHPYNPHAPTAHFNVRAMIVEKNAEQYWWFGGGFDLTPYYGYVEDCKHWHAMAKAACDPFGSNVYAHYKKWADDYFYIKHRKEARGIGGIFFDDLNEWKFSRCFDFMQSVGEHFIKAYLPIIEKRKNHPFKQKERDFQLYRRGRYVEFNLLYDRGTLFGLQSNGRTESILMSLPPLVAWEYNSKGRMSKAEEILYESFLKPRDWLAA